jgi:NAD(P)-dependent dehydrogenase (short-subunit alcohol dehydrogenase family)
MPSVLVTGAARGIGRAIVEHLSSTGWEVVALLPKVQAAVVPKLPVSLRDRLMALMVRLPRSPRG